MCGILGIVGDSSPETQRCVERQSNAMRVRGPHAEGLWHEAGVILAHRRLMIIDLSDRSNQPIAAESGRSVLVYNGEIYNYRELSPAGTPGDTLALAADDAGARDPGRLRGMFAYALWDREQHRLLLARDRFGIKPLYYGVDGSSLAFGSTASSVAQMLGADTVDREGVASFLRLGSVQGPRTITQGVAELDPGSTLEWADGLAHRERYWAFDDSSDPTVADLHETLRASVAAHALSDVPVALFLSGGVDSAVVGALAVEAGVDLTAFTLGFPGSDVDEADDARATAKALRLKHEVVDFREAVPDFDGYFAATDQPSIDGLNTYLISGAAARSGFRVALTGLGADEFFGGYSTFRRIPALWAMNAMLPSAVVTRLLRLSRGNAAKAAGLSACGADLNRLAVELRSVFSTEEVRRLTGVRWAAPEIPVSIRAPMDAVTRLEMENYLRNTLLRDADVFSMAHSLEMRTPFVDHQVLAAARSITNVRRAWYRKRLLADALGSARVNDLIRKPKRGFRLPFPEWLRGPLSQRVEELTGGPLRDACDEAEVRHHVNAWKTGGAPYARVWSLVVLDAWLRRKSGSHAVSRLDPAGR